MDKYWNKATDIETQTLIAGNIKCKEYYMISLQYPSSIVYNTRSIVHDEGGYCYVTG